MRSNVIFAAERVEEVQWNVTIDGQLVRISDSQMEELTRRFLWSRKLKAVDAEGKLVALKGVFGNIWP